MNMRKNAAESGHDFTSELQWDPKLPSPAVPRGDQKATRMSILMCLSDVEIARLHAMETGPALDEGAEYIDLEKPAKGVCRVYATTTLTVRNILPRAAVRGATWSKVCALLET